MTSAVVVSCRKRPQSRTVSSSGGSWCRSSWWSWTDPPRWEITPPSPAPLLRTSKWMRQTGTTNLSLNKVKLPSAADWVLLHPLFPVSCFLFLTGTKQEPWIQLWVSSSSWPVTGRGISALFLVPHCNTNIYSPEQELHPAAATCLCTGLLGPQNSPSRSAGGSVVFGVLPQFVLFILFCTADFKTNLSYGNWTLCRTASKKKKYNLN